MGNKRRSIVGFVIAFALLGALIYTVGTEEIAEALGKTDGSLALIAVAPALTALLFRGLVWTRLLRVVEHGVGAGRIFSVYLFSTLVKFVTPYGQVSALPVMTYLLVRYTDAEYDEGFASVVSIDITNFPVPLVTFGAFSLVVFLLGGMPSAELDGWYPVALVGFFVVMTLPLVVVIYARDFVERFAVTASAISAVVVERTASFFGVLEPGESRASKVTERLLTFLSEENIRERTARFYDTVDDVLENRNDLGVALVYSHIGWFLLAVPLYFLIAAVGGSTGIVQVVLIVAVSRLGVFVPVPGGLGPVEGLLAGAIALVVGLEPATATAVALLYRLLTYWIPVLVGGGAAVYLFVTAE